MPTPRSLQFLLAAAAAAVLCGSAAAQSHTYELNEDRTLTPTDAPPLEGDAAVIARARRALADDQPSVAKSALDQWVGRNERTQNPYLAEAYLLRGDAWVALKERVEALYDYETVIQQFPQSDQFVTAIDRELQIALRFANGEKRRVLLIFWVDASDLAVEVFIRTQERLPGSQLAERAAIELADFYYRERELTLARDAYDLYLENFPKGPNKIKAAQRRIFCDIARFKGPRYESASLIDASERIKDFQRVFPAEAEKTGLDAALLTRLDESRAAQMLESARWYLRVDDEPSARYMMKRLLKAHPGTIAADQAIATMKEKGWIENPAEKTPAEPSPADQPRVPATEAATPILPPANPEGAK